MGTKLTGHTRRHYQIPDKQIEQIRLYMRRNHIQHEVIAVRQLLSMGHLFSVITARTAGNAEGNADESSLEKSGQLALVDDG